MSMWTCQLGNVNFAIWQCELRNLAKWSQQNEQVKSTRQNGQIAMWTFGFGQADLQHGTIELGKIGEANIPISFVRMGALNWFWWISCVPAAPPPSFLPGKNAICMSQCDYFSFPKKLFCLPHYDKFSWQIFFDETFHKREANRPPPIYNLCGIGLCQKIHKTIQ